MLRPQLSNHFKSSFHFSDNHSGMARKTSERDLDTNSFASLLSQFGAGIASAIGKPPAARNKKSNSVGGVSIPQARYHGRRRATDEEIPKNDISENFSSNKKHLISDRSYSCPSDESQKSDNRSVSSQLSLFQSAFDSDYDITKDHYRYDVNISCHKNQLVWVEGFLLPIMEKELGLNCYLYERDNLPGVSSVKNIAAAVKESRLTILCFSKDYLSSSWQNYEALLAHHLDPGGWKKRILPIMVENCALPFKYTVYATLKWPECGSNDNVPASVKLRRRFFISGLLNALGMQDKEMMLEIYKEYCGLSIPVVATPTQRYCFV